MSVPVADLVRAHAALAQCEIALVRRDPVAAALLSQAARHGEGLPGAPLVVAAAGLVRAAGHGAPGSSPPGRAARKVAQALVRAAVLEIEGVLLAPPATRRG